MQRLCRCLLMTPLLLRGRLVTFLVGEFLIISFYHIIPLTSEKGVVAIFGPTSKFSSEHIRSITDSMEIPFIETRWNYRSQRKVIGNKLHITL